MSASVWTARRRWTLVRAIISYAIGIITVIPILYLVLSSLRPNSDIFDITMIKAWTLDNFSFALFSLPLGRYLLNSAIVSVSVTAVALLAHSMAGYALARLSFKGRDVFFGAIISTMLVSLSVILVPLFLVVRELGITNSYFGLIIPSIFNAYGIFLLRQYYVSFPKELEESAEVDGCGIAGRFFRVVLPYSRGILTALAILFFLANWNAFLWPLTITNSSSLYVIQVGISTLQGQYSSNWGVILAASVIAAIPTAVMFISGQKYILEVLRTASK